MNDDLTHIAFFGDGERTFKLTPELIVELERKTDTGIGALSRRVFRGDFKHSDLTEIIRLALIGGGTSPRDADALVAAYAVRRPINEVFPLAVSVLEAAWFGAKGKTDDAQA